MDDQEIMANQDFEYDEDERDIEDRLYAQVYHSNNVYQHPAQQSTVNNVHSNSSIDTGPNPSNMSSECTTDSEILGLYRTSLKRSRPLIDGLICTPNKLPRLQTTVRASDDPQEELSATNTATSHKTRIPSPSTSKPQTMEKLTEEEEEEEEDEEDDDDDDCSKYTVTAKVSAKTLRAMEDSDSEESIFEVPVPPKPSPPVIDLNDSDEESPVIMDNEKDMMDSSNNDTVISATSDSIMIEDSLDSDSSDSHNSDRDCEVDNLTLNCTTVQRGVASLEELRKLTQPQNVDSVLTQSDEEGYWPEGSKDRQSAGSEIRDLLNEFSDDDGAIHNLLDDSGSQDNDDCDQQYSNISMQESGNSTSTPQKQPAEKSSREVENSKGNPNGHEPMPQYMVDFYNEPREGSIMKDVAEIQNDMPKDPRRWAILNADMVPMPRYRDKVCENCHRYGHTFRKCPRKPQKVPVCHFCGMTGHDQYRCPHNKLCANCGKKSDKFRSHCQRCKKLKCNQCSERGHTANQCPDNWRKYHQTISGYEVIIPANPGTVLKPASQLRCCNCAGRGHDVASCNQHWSSKHFINPSYVRDYTKGPCYSSPSPCESRQMGSGFNKGPIIEIVVDDGEEVPTSSQQSVSPDKHHELEEVFNFRNTTEATPSTWKECSFSPNEVNDAAKICINGTLLLPNFLKYHFNGAVDCPMEIIIKKYAEVEDQIVIILRMPDEDSLGKLKILVNQWLTRSPEDKLTIEMTKCRLPQRRTEMLLILRERTLNMMKKSLPKKLFKIQKKMEKFEGDKLRDLKSAFMIAAYKYLLIDTPMDPLKNFVDFYDQIDSLSSENVPPSIYLTAYWYFFELFVPHYSPLIKRVITSWSQNSKLHRRGYDIYQKWAPFALVGIKKNPTVKKPTVSRATEVMCSNDNSSVCKTSKLHDESKIREVNDPGARFHSQQNITSNSNTIVSNPECRIEPLALWRKLLLSRKGSKGLPKDAKNEKQNPPKLSKKAQLRKLYPNMPRANDGRSYKKPKDLLKYTQEALTIIDRYNLEKSAALARRLMGNENRVDGHSALITLWSSIRLDLYDYNNRVIDVE